MHLYDVCRYNLQWKTMLYVICWYFAYYCLHSINVKNVFKRWREEKNWLFFIQIFAQYFSLRGRLESNVIKLKKKYPAPVIKTNFCTYATLEQTECIFVEIMEFGKDYLLEDGSKNIKISKLTRFWVVPHCHISHLSIFFTIHLFSLFTWYSLMTRLKG